MATISITTPDNKGSNTTICVPSQNKAINREQRYQFEKTNATNLGNPPANINSTSKCAGPSRLTLLFFLWVGKCRMPHEQK